MTKLPPWSYTFLTDYQNCPAKAFHKHVAKDCPYEETVATRWGNTVHTALDARIGSGKPLTDQCARFEKWAKPFDGKRVETEVKVGVRRDGSVCGFHDDDVWGRIKIDVLYLIEDHSARIFDWKTGNRREDPFELRLAGLFAQARVPSLRYMSAWYVWLGEGPDGKLGPMHDVSDVERTWAEVESMTHTVENYAAINHWPEKENPLCKWCPVKTCRFNKNRG